MVKKLRITTKQKSARRKNIAIARKKKKADYKGAGASVKAMLGGKVGGHMSFTARGGKVSKVSITPGQGGYSSMKSRISRAKRVQSRLSKRGIKSRRRSGTSTVTFDFNKVK